MTAKANLEPDGFFLSAANPTATAEQLDMERQAIRLLETPALQAAKAIAATRLKTLGGAGAPPEVWEPFDEQMTEWTFEMTLKAICSDSNYPRLLHHMYGPAHEWFGLKVPACIGFGGDNVDVVYSMFAIDPYSHFELFGQRSEPEVVDGLIETNGSLSLAMTLGHLDWRDLEFQADGTFVIGFGPEPANGRRNYIQLKRDVRYGFLRNVRSDWMQIPPVYRVRRLDPPSAAPLSERQVLERAALYVVDDIPATHYWVGMINALPQNTLHSPAGGSVIVGGLQQRGMAFGRLRIEEDEAYVVTVGAGGAGYRGLAVMNYWMHSLDSGNRTSSLSNAQSLANADGTFTYVVTSRDPGIHNWLDCAGLREPKIMHRWHLLPRDPGPLGGPSIRGELVKLADLDRALPPETKRMTPAGRKQQLTERSHAFKRRYAER